MWKLEHRLQFVACVGDLVQSATVQSMQTVSHHTKEITCYDHSLYVSYVSFKLSRFFGGDAISAARGGLLHDLYLYDKEKQKSMHGRHLFIHPCIALKKASSLYELNDKEKDIIIKHMWPLTPHMPKYKESFIVSIADKLCSIAEVSRLYKLMHVADKLKVPCANYQVCF